MFACICGAASTGWWRRAALCGLAFATHLKGIPAMTRSRRRSKSTVTAGLTAADLTRMVLSYFKAHPKEILSAVDIAAKFGAAAAQVDTLLMAAVEAGQLRHQNMGQHGLVYRAGTAVSFPDARAPKLRAAVAAGRRARREAVKIDLSEIKIEHGVPLTKARPRSEEWADLFRKMAPGDSFPVPSIAHDALSHAKCQFVKAEPTWRFTIRRQADDTSRIWRLK